MCGIVGIAGRSLEGRVNEQVSEMTAKIKHRGPDSHNTYVSEDNMAAFGHARLEIVGGEIAAQPMLQNNKGPLSIVFNGEIYNYKDLRSRLTSDFFTQSDTEVILNGYAEKGESILDELNGQFAFAIYDTGKRKLFIARDRMGEKPLYYAHIDGKLYFASEIKALQSQLKLQPKVTPEFIEFETTVGKDTLFEGIFMLEPGEALSYYPAEDRLEIRKYWEFPFSKPALEGSERELIVTLDEALKESVSLRVPPGQPYGIMVSGGLDSSTLALLCSAVRKPEFLFMTRFPGMPVQYDEAEYAREVAKAVKVQLIEITPTADDFRNFMPDILYHLDQPMASAALLPAYMIAKKAKELGMKVIISGIGPDEFIAGYARHPIMTRDINDIIRYANDNNLLGAEWEAMKAYLPLMQYFVSGNGISGIDFNIPADRYYHLIRRGVSGSNAPKEFVRGLFEQTAARGVLAQAGYTDIMVSLPPLIQLEDKIFSAFGIENRGPYLDYKTVETMFRMPGALKIQPGTMTMKHCLREVARNNGVPLKVVGRTNKVGFAAPFNAWLANELAGWKDNVLGSADLSSFQSKAELPSRGNYGRETYHMLNIALWLNSFQ